MLRNLFLFVPFLLLVNVTSAVALPPCPGTYDGTWTNCVGAFSFPEGDTYTGGWRNGAFDGHGTYTWVSGPNSGDKYVGEWRAGKKHGQGTYTFANGDKYVGEFRNGSEHGQGTYTIADDSSVMVFGRSGAGLEAVGEFVDSFANGNMTLYWANGDVWLGRVRDSASGEEWLGGNKYKAGNVPPEVYAASGRDAPLPIEPPPSDYTPPPPTPTSDTMSIDKAKSECEELGFEPKTEKFGECVLSLTN